MSAPPALTLSVGFHPPTVTMCVFIAAVVLSLFLYACSLKSVCVRAGATVTMKAALTLSFKCDLSSDLICGGGQSNSTKTSIVSKKDMRCSPAGYFLSIPCDSSSFTLFSN